MRFCMGAENAKMKSAEKSDETGGNQLLTQMDVMLDPSPLKIQTVGTLLKLLILMTGMF